MNMTHGMKTSEFWLSGVMPFLMIILNHVLGWGLSPQELAMGTFGTSSYGVSRGLSKNKSTSTSK